MSILCLTLAKVFIYGLLAHNLVLHERNLHLNLLAPDLAGDLFLAVEQVIPIEAQVGEGHGSDLALLVLLGWNRDRYGWFSDNGRSRLRFRFIICLRVNLVVEKCINYGIAIGEI